MEPAPRKVVFFDLDGTLFGHHHSLQMAMSAVRRKYPALAKKKIEELIDRYSIALQQAYDSYLDKVITYEEADIWKIELFFAALGLLEPTQEKIQRFRATYKEVYREDRRATPRSIETLARLREHGYRIAIITNGRLEDQTAKAKTIGILHLTDRIITSEETGHRKPDSRIFQYAIKQPDAPLRTTYMVGDSADAYIKGALDAQLAAIMYSPVAQDSHHNFFSRNRSQLSAKWANFLAISAFDDGRRTSSLRSFSAGLSSMRDWLPKWNGSPGDEK